MPIPVSITDIFIRVRFEIKHILSSYFYTLNVTVPPFFVNFRELPIYFI